MILLGMDLATSTGFAYARPHLTPICGSVRAPVTGGDLGAFGAFYWRFLSNLIAELSSKLGEHENMVVIYEAPILPRQTRLATTRKLQALGVILETVCALHAADSGKLIEVVETNLKSIKKELAGTGGASKAMMVHAAKRAGISLPEEGEEDAADAFGAFLMGVRHYATPTEAAYWDRRIWGGQSATGLRELGL